MSMSMICSLEINYSTQFLHNGLPVWLILPATTEAGGSRRASGNKLRFWCKEELRLSLIVQTSFFFLNSYLYHSKMIENIYFD